jgi:hypothetical protein
MWPGPGVVRCRETFDQRLGRATKRWPSFWFEVLGSKYDFALQPRHYAH